MLLFRPETADLETLYFNSAKSFSITYFLGGEDPYHHVVYDIVVWVGRWREFVPAKHCYPLARIYGVITEDHNINSGITFKRINFKKGVHFERMRNCYRPNTHKFSCHSHSSNIS
jgi:hypothetical protein